MKFTAQRSNDKKTYGAVKNPYLVYGQYDLKQEMLEDLIANFNEIFINFSKRIIKIDNSAKIEKNTPKG
jgi:thymidylate kinase